MTSESKLELRRESPLRVPSDLHREAVKEISGPLNALLADVFALYLKSKNFRWHMSGPHFRDYYLLLDEQSDELFAMVDDIANGSERSEASRFARLATSAECRGSKITMQSL